jgi:hypothetical protein
VRRIDGAQQHPSSSAPIIVRRGRTEVAPRSAHVGGVAVVVRLRSGGGGACAGGGLFRTVVAMSIESTPPNAIEDKVVDIETFGQCYGLMLNLSRYLDNVAGGVLAGSIEIDAAAPFVKRAAGIYEDLRQQLVAQITDDELAAAASEMLRPLDADETVLEAALVVDQSQSWIDSTLKHGSFSHRIKLLGLQFGLEAAATTAQLGEQREKAESFQGRLTTGAPGLYV